MSETTNWNCKKCKKQGSFNHNGLDVWSGAQKVKEEHAKVSPTCKWDGYKVRVQIVVKG